MPPLGSKLPIYGQESAVGRPGADGRSRWRSLEELANRALPSPEFPEAAAEPPAGVSRRTFLQLLGASAALASLDACRPPRHKIVPYVRPPEKAILPGTAMHYATAVSWGGHATGLLVTCYDGRPTKVEGNPEHPSSLGGVGSFELATLLDLYDPRRAKGFKKGQAPLPYRALLRELAALAATHEKDGGARLRFLTGDVGSPVLVELRRRILARFPKARFTAYESVGHDQAYEGARLAFGRPVEVRRTLREARVILALDDDFLHHGPEALRLAREFAERREPGAEMNRLYVAEAHHSVTGTSADHRFRMKPSEVLGFARAVAARLASAHGLSELAALGGGETRLAKQAQAVADDLARARGRSLVTVGPRQPPAMHALAHVVNAALGNAGKTVEYAAALHDVAAGPGALRELAAELSGGQIDTLVVSAFDPVYTAPADVDLAAALGKVAHAIYLGYRDDETAPRASWVLARSHPFETWGDARAHDGTASIVQPLIQPLFESLSELELLASFVDLGDVGAYRVLKDSWQRRAPGGDFERQWERWLAKGVIDGTATPAEGLVPNAAAVAEAVRAAPGGPGRALQGSSSAEGGAASLALEASFIPDYKLLDGRFAENAWLQELPDPLLKITWDNAAQVSPATASQLGLENGTRVELRLAGRTVEAAAWIVPGHADGVVTLPLGYGRRRAGPVGTEVGFDAGRLRSSNAPWFAGGLAVAKLGRRKHDFAVTQEHFSMEGREIALAFDRKEWKPEHVAGVRGPVETIQEPVDYSQQPYKWGMAIDLAKCIGCGACTTACQAENNIPVVGKEQVLRSREMHWLRVDRYFEGTPEDPRVIAQPMLCQHCETAPCEYVCPVNATVHSDEGLNEMVYNRCVGTRYCSNNCPYKVRRFNYLDFRGDLSPTEKMAMNPDVTVRTRGVMEKCTYCVQRIERARIETRVEGRTIREGEFTTACAQACPSRAIVFGNLNDPKSAVSRLHQDERRYDVLHELGTRPRTAYLVRIRNPNPELT
ncbi:MAG TPA: TAT-variant-translocated molybdopterin oxidoreductase [Anaeromyxobacteraceae bacterium]|nr:TAT-variant-translocated molybdopterin oxidoreductase [Anaeromyxobacteraceae bacterium]